MSALALCAASTASAAGKYDLAALHNSVTAAYQNLLNSTSELAGMKCLDPVSVQVLTDFQTQTEQVYRDFDKSFRTYITEVTKPMPGNGRCNGGFESVAEGSEHRGKLTEDFGAKVFEIQKNFGDNMNANFLDGAAGLAATDDTEEEDCGDTSDKLYAIAEMNGRLAHDQLTSFRFGLFMTQMDFAFYTAKNKNLQNDCGSISESLAGIPQESALAGLKTGKQMNGASTVTGKIQNEQLASGSGTRKISSSWYKEGKVETPATITAADNTAGASSASQGLSLQEKEAILKNGLGKSNLDTGTAPTRSEEFAVQQMLNGKGFDSRAPASMQNSGALELMMDAKRSADSAAAGKFAAGTNTPAVASAEKAGNGISAEGGGAPGMLVLAGAKAVAEASLGSLVLGPADEALFERIHAVLRRGKLDLEKSHR